MKSRALAGILAALVLAFVIPIIGAAQNKAPQSWTTRDLYRKSPNLHEQKHPMSADTAGHCQWMADRYREMAQKKRDLAKLHEEMAKPAS